MIYFSTLCRGVRLYAPDVWEYFNCACCKEGYLNCATLPGDFPSGCPNSDAVGKALHIKEMEM